MLSYLGDTTLEDDVVLNAMLCMQFAEQGLDLSAVASLREARQVLVSSAPDLVLLDQQLPDGFGVDFLQELRGSEPDLPVVMMTGLHDAQDKRDDVPRTLDEVVAKHLQYVLDYGEGHKGRSCEVLDIARPALERKIRKYGLVLP